MKKPKLHFANKEDIKIILKTVGGYEIKNFKVMTEPRQRYPLNPMLYTGTIFDEKMGENCELEWDITGRCSNWGRPDCFINVFDIRNFLLIPI